jgi:phytoene dehydrogenase-like protein
VSRAPFVANFPRCFTENLTRCGKFAWRKQYSLGAVWTGGCMRTERDVIIVGGGHNGLACAAYLAKQGLDVLVVERRDILGGAAVTEEPWPGYRISSASYVVSLMPPLIESELQLKRFGYKVSILEPDYYVPLPRRLGADAVGRRE